MSRVFWDSMLFIYLVEADATFAPVVLNVLERCASRGDTLHTSHLSVAETLVGLPQGGGKEHVFLETLHELNFVFSDFNGDGVSSFRRLRRDFGLQQPDALNLACAAAIGVDIYLTNDEHLLKKRLHVPGIQFIADFTKAPL